MIGLLVGLSSMVTSTWVIASVGFDICRRLQPDSRITLFYRTIWAELRPFYLPAAAVWIVDRAVHGEVKGWGAFVVGCTIANWFFFKDLDDDDRWKRRKAKAVEKLERRGSRLVAVPVEGS